MYARKQPSGASRGDSGRMRLTGVGIDWTFASYEDVGSTMLAGFLARSVAMLIALGGLCVTALMLGIVSEQISHMIEDLKKGRSEVGGQLVLECILHFHHAHAG